MCAVHTGNNSKKTMASEKNALVDTVPMTSTNLVCYITAAYMGLNFLLLGSGVSGPSASLCNQKQRTLETILTALNP